MTADKNSVSKMVSGVLIVLLVLTSLSAPVAGQSPEGPANETAVTPAEVVEAMDNETAYRTNFSIEMHAGDRYQGMDGWMVQNQTVNRAHGEMVLSGEESVSARFYATESRFYFNRTRDRQWYWDDTDDQLVTESIAPLADLLQNGTIVRTEANPGSATTTFVIEPTAQEYREWADDSDAEMDVSQSRFRITVDNETARIRHAEIDMAGTVDGEAFTVSGTIEYSSYGAVGNITIPENVQNARESTLITSLTDGYGPVPGNIAYKLRTAINSHSERQLLGLMALMTSSIVLSLLLLYEASSENDSLEDELTTHQLEDNDS
jgi:hypothetical protein